MLWDPKEIVFRVVDYETVKSFYKAVLSLELVDESPNEWVLFDMGAILLRLVKEDFPDLPPDFGKSSEIVFTVKSMKEILEILSKLRVEYRIERRGNRRDLTIQDPEGRYITFTSKV